MTSSGAGIHVLHVDDEPDVAELSAEFLRREHESMSVRTASEALEGLRALRENGFDCIVSDYDMPGDNGIEFLRSVREEYPDLPFILFTGKGSEEVASEAISAGVSDYLQKGAGTERYSLLANRIENLVTQYRAETELENRAVQQRKVADLGRRALAGDGLDGLFDEAISVVADTLDNEYAEVLEDRPKQEDLLLRAGVGWQDGLVGEATVGTGEHSQAGHTLNSEEPIVVEDLRSEDRFTSPSLLVDHDVISGISVVIGSREDPWGVFGTHTTERTVFTDDDITFVQNVANILATAIDRHQSEEQLRETREWYQQILNSLSDYVIVVDDSTQITYASPAIERVMGYRPDDVIGTDALEYVYPNDLEKAAEAFAETVDSSEEEVRVEYRAKTADGEPLWIEARGANYLDDPVIGGILISVRDISERKRREQQHERERDRFITLFEHLPNPVVHSEVHENDAVIKRVNPAFEDTFGHDRGAVVGQTIDELIVPADRREEGRDINERLIENGQLTTGVRRQTAKGEREFILNGVISEQNSLDESYTIYTDVSDLKQRERELQKAERRFQAMFDDPNILVGLLDTDGTVIDVNDMAMEYIDDELEEVRGTPFWETSWFTGDAEIQTDVQEWIRRSANGEYVEFEVDLSESVEDSLVVSGVFRPVLDVDGNVVSLLISDRDITKRKQRERELRQERDRFRAVFEKATDAMVIADNEGRYLDANPHAADLFGMDREDLVGRSIAEFAPEDFDFDAAWEQFQRSDRERGTFPLIRTDGDRRTVEYAASAQIAEGQHLSVLRDVTDRNLREDRLQQTTARLEALYENSPDMINVLDTDGRLIDVNNRFCQELGYTEKELLGRPIWEIDVAVSENDVHTLLTGFDLNERRKFEGTYERREGSTFPVEVHLLRLNVAGADRFIAISRDISERKAYERSLERQNERLQEFAGLVSHDLRNPLNVAEGRLDLAREDCDSEHLDPIEGALDRMDTLIENMLELARLGQQVSETEPVDLAELTEICWDHVETGDASLVTADAPTIEGDRSRAQQLLENLIRNSVEHGGEEVTITIGEIGGGFYVEDDGVGIPEDIGNKIFESGYSTSDEGTGFGLSIVEQIAEAHGWTVEGTTGTDAGARFEFTGVRTR